MTETDVTKDWDALADRLLSICACAERGAAYHGNSDALAQQLTYIANRLRREVDALRAS